MNSKDNKKPVLICNPNTDEWVNLTSLFEMEEQVGDSLSDIARNFETGVIRFINEKCTIADDCGDQAQGMFFWLYKVVDALKGIEKVKC